MQTRAYFLAQVNEESVYPLERNYYCPARWNRSLIDGQCHAVNDGDLLAMYFGGKSIRYKKQLAVVFKVMDVVKGGRCFDLEPLHEFDPPLRLQEIRQLVSDGELDPVFSNCGQQGFSIIDIQKSQFDKLNRVGARGGRPLAFTAKAMDLRTKRKGLPERIKTQTYRILRDTKLTRELKSQYHNGCLICGKSISLGDSEYSEAHHVRPLGKKHGGPDDRSSIVILCPNHHVEFDYGVIAIDPDTLRVMQRS